MKRTALYLIFLFCICLYNSCSDSPEKTPDWIWNPDEEEEEADPPVDVREKPRFIWIDAAANFPDYANSKENIETDLAKVQECGFTDIVVDVRPSMGDVLFHSSIAEEVTKLDYWSPTGYIYYERTETWDYLQAFIDAGHALGLRVHAAINTFTGGHRYLYGLGEQGLLFREPDKKHWATVLNLETGLTNTMDIQDDSYGAKFFNPAHEEVQEYLLTLLGELAQYKVDGIFLDRCRYDDMRSDFSQDSRTKFEQYTGQTIDHFPDDILLPGTSTLPSSQPPYFKKWLEFRAKTIHDFIVKARARVKSVNAEIIFGVYVGAWYSSYYEYGVNWASPRFDAAASYSAWATSEYNTFGYADHLDYLLLGAYAPANRIYGSGEWSVQGFCSNAATLLMGDVAFAGGPDVGNWEVPEGTDVRQAVTNSVDAAIHVSDGYFLFDLIHVKKYDYWNELRNGIEQYVLSYKF